MQFEEASKILKARWVLLCGLPVEFPILGTLLIEPYSEHFCKRGPLVEVTFSLIGPRNAKAEGFLLKIR